MTDRTYWTTADPTALAAVREGEGAWTSVGVGTIPVGDPVDETIWRPCREWEYLKALDEQDKGEA